MRAASGHIWDLWNAGGPFVGEDGAPHGRVTVEIGWELRESVGPVGAYKKLPVRWFQRADASQVETEIPGLKSIGTDVSVDTDAGTCEIVIYNQKMAPVDAARAELGNPGYLSYTRGASAAAAARWGHEANEWTDVLVPDALIRSYQGYGGRDKTISRALADGNLLQTGTWLVDEVRINTNGTLTLRCRDMRKLLIDQPLYPPLVPLTDTDGASLYPIEYSRFRARFVSTPIVIYGHTTDPRKLIVGVEADLAGNGYWLAGDEGGVFTFGDNYFYGSMGSTVENAVTIGITRTVTGKGYWLAGADGGVFAFGDAIYHGGAVGETLSAPIMAIERSGAGGYWLFGADGGVFTYGDAQFYGSGVGVTSSAVAGAAAMPDGTGYWLCGADGAVYAFGGAGYHGNILGGAPYPIAGMERTPTGLGYYLVDTHGEVYAFGDAVYRGGAGALTLQDPVTDIAVHPSGNGYWLVAEDGGVFTYPSTDPLVQFYGSLPGLSDFAFPLDGNMTDWADIVKAIALWCGWWLEDGGVEANVFGNIESTNAYPSEQLPREMFDKQPAIDPLTKIREAVGYLIRTDCEGALYFTSPNWWSPGNFLPNGSHTSVIPEIDEKVNLVDYALSHSDTTARSLVVIATTDPLDNFEGTLSATRTPPGASVLRGIRRPAMYAADFSMTQADLDAMADLIGVQLMFQQRLGSVSAWCLPLLEIDDQVVIWERQTGEAYIHYVRSISTNMDLDTGQWLMQLTTHWLGEEGAWAVAIPAHPVAAPSDVGSGTEGSPAISASSSVTDTGHGTDNVPVIVQSMRLADAASSPDSLVRSIPRSLADNAANAGALVRAAQAFARFVADSAVSPDSLFAEVDALVDFAASADALSRGMFLSRTPADATAATDSLFHPTIAFRSEASGRVSFPYTLVTVSEPTGTVAGDILVCYIVNNTGVLGLVVPPAGWRSLGGAGADLGRGAGTGSGLVMQSFWIERGASAPALRFLFVLALGWHVQAYSGASGASLIAGTGAKTASSTTINFSSVTTTRDGSLYVAVMTWGGTPTVTTAPSGTTMRAKQALAPNNQTADVTITVTGVVAAKTATLSVALDNLGFPFAISP